MMHYSQSVHFYVSSSSYVICLQTYVLFVKHIVLMVDDALYKSPSLYCLMLT